MIIFIKIKITLEPSFKSRKWKEQGKRCERKRKKRKKEKQEKKFIQLQVPFFLKILKKKRKKFPFKIFYFLIKF